MVFINSCTRYIFGLRKYDHISSYSLRLLGCNIFQYIKFRWCYYLFRLLIYKQPSYLFDKFSFGRSVRNININIPGNCSSQLNASFFVRGSIFWNELPASVKTSRTCREFKKLCLAHCSES